MSGDSATPGVYAEEDDGRLVLVHEYLDGEYELEDVHRIFGLGEPVETPVDAAAAFSIDRKAARELRVNADAYSFDYEAGFIEMCLDIERYVEQTGRPRLKLVGID